ncbi:Zn(2)-C6 fungal-type DNA-binding domain protein [Ophiocordyceps sinensis CO18]|uniref:Zn(2)-C6 fungal-type DNA-binding domain protein n=1 Tax=Ophiocordyceps sinensis (strain Co18 / CGMCC 3.14243) TaxID=911162 RepID=T5ACG6_OPHSC|nr:Zn(2)-C6 fungal-type DNA-binding domain protein [Ophiocordyceps sinensis CO18]
MSSVKTKKKSAFSCDPCRRRKVKCGGEQPVCQRCAARNDQCIYKLNPTLSYTQRLEERIKELEDQLANSAQSPVFASSSSQPSPPVHDAHDGPSKRSSDQQCISRSFRGLKIDDKGGITYHGTTSFFNLPSDRAPAVVADRLAPTDTDVQRRERLVNNAWQQRALENMSDIPEPFQYLLNVHWCWIQPMFNFIYRPAFTRDMQSLGPYYSHTLLNAVISHSIRWGQSDPSTKRLLDDSYDGGAVFAEHTRSMVFEELSRGVCTVPTVQTLLLLKGFLSRQKSNVSFVVHRIFWSCYFWDKLISLYLGRSPSLQQSSISPPQIMFDDSAEDEIWVPFGAQQVGVTWKYPPTTAHSASCFMSMCRLSVIFNEILIHMYDPLSQNTDVEVQECLRLQEPAFQEWWSQLPPHLRIDPAALPTLAPPSHIVTLNCLYHTFKILLYRPMLTGRGKRNDDDGDDDDDDDGVSPAKSHLVECVSSATAIITIFDLFCRTFTMNYCVLSLAYSVYTAASVFLLQVQASPGEQQAMRKLEYCCQCLSQVKNISPVINSALNLITSAMNGMGLGIPSPHQSHPVPATTRCQVPVPVLMYQNPVDVSRQVPLPSHPLFRPSMNHMLGPESMAMHPDVFETMSTLEPLSVRVGAIQGSENQSSMG